MVFHSGILIGLIMTVAMSRALQLEKNNSANQRPQKSATDAPVGEQKATAYSVLKMWPTQGSVIIDKVVQPTHSSDKDNNGVKPGTPSNLGIATDLNFSMATTSVRAASTSVPSSSPTSSPSFNGSSDPDFRILETAPKKFKINRSTNSTQTTSSTSTVAATSTVTVPTKSTAGSSTATASTSPPTITSIFQPISSPAQRIFGAEFLQASRNTSSPLLVIATASNGTESSQRSTASSRTPVKSTTIQSPLSSTLQTFPQAPIISPPAARPPDAAAVAKLDPSQPPPPFQIPGLPPGPIASSNNVFRWTGNSPAASKNPVVDVKNESKVEKSQQSGQLVGGTLRNSTISQSAIKSSAINNSQSTRSITTPAVIISTINLRSTTHPAAPSVPISHSSNLSALLFTTSKVPSTAVSKSPSTGSHPLATTNPPAPLISLVPIQTSVVFPFMAIAATPPSTTPFQIPGLPPGAIGSANNVFFHLTTKTTSIPRSSTEGSQKVTVHPAAANWMELSLQQKAQWFKEGLKKRLAFVSVNDSSSVTTTKLG